MSRTVSGGLKALLLSAAMLPWFLVVGLAIAPSPPNTFGAAALVNSDVDWAAVQQVDSMTPTPAEAAADVPEHESRGCMDGFTTTGGLVVCHDGNPEAERIVMLVGDSKIVQWSPAIVSLALEAGWRVESLYFPNCPYTDGGVNHGERVHALCLAWNVMADAYILDHPPDLLITSSMRKVGFEIGDDHANQTVSALADSYARTWVELVAAGISVAVIVDNPLPQFHVYECVADNPTSLNTCSFGYEPGIAASGAETQLMAAERVPGVSVIDLNEWLCPQREACPPVIGDVLLYRQGSHLTRTYVETLTPYVADAIAHATDGLFPG